MKSSAKTTQETFFPELLEEPAYIDGKDELNLAEFPISSVATRTDSSQKTITFEDRIYDKASESIVPRKLVITGSDEWGLPTTLDDQVMFGLLQLTRLRNFESPTIEFTRAELIKILRWPEENYYYRRIEESLTRWVGTTLHYENAWRDKRTGEWVTVTFHLIDRAEIRKRANKTLSGRSAFTWNPHIFENFKAGNIKSIDFHIYTMLETAVAKRVFRFLDKRFYQRASWSFDLEDFAFDKIGMSRTYKPAEIKRRLAPALKELERLKVIRAQPASARYERIRRGVWHIHFQKYSVGDETQRMLGEEEQVSVLEAALVKHGVSRTEAKRFIAKYPPDFLEAKIEALEFRIAHGVEVESPGGYLAQSIRDDFANPKGFKTRVERAQEAAEATRKAQEREDRLDANKRAEKRRQALLDAQLEKEEVAVAAFLENLSSRELLEIETEALKPFGNKGKTLGPKVKQTMIRNHVVELLKEKKIL